MNRILLFLLAIATFLPGCKKKNSISPSSVHTSPSMNGTFIWIGRASSSGIPAAPDAFTMLAVKVLDDSSVIVNSDTLRFNSVDTSLHAYHFYLNADPLNYRINTRNLYYNYINGSLRYSYEVNASYGGAYLDVSTIDYKPNPMINNYVNDIAVTRTMSGTVSDNFRYSPTNDTMYHLNLSIKFSKVDDSTIAFDNSVLKLEDAFLHYKSTDYTNKTVTFQTFHTYDYKISTLTYNYGTNQVLFEYHAYTGGETKDVQLQ